MATDVTASRAPWRWPLAPLGERHPIIHTKRMNDRHAIALGYALSPEDRDLVVPVYAVQSGTVAAALHERGGYVVVVDHEPTHATRYAYLSHLRVRATDGLDGRARERVNAGDVIGYVAHSPLGVQFELWQWQGRDCIPIDPYAALTSWGAPALAVAPATAHDETGE